MGRGRRIFMRSCTGCHGVDGRGVRRVGLNKAPRDLTQPAFHAEASDERLRTSIRVGKGQMPAFGGLMSAEDVEQVIAFIRSLNPEAARGAPSPAAGAGPASPAAATGTPAPSSSLPAQPGVR
jgi:mono/diheme cytochrome c family protein